MEMAAAVASFAGLGVTAAQIYTKLSTLACQIRLARDQVLRIAQDVSGVEAVIQQLTDLLKAEELPQAIDSINKSLRLIQDSRASCQSLFESIERSLKEVSKQIKAKGLSPGEEIKLSNAEQAL
jgi:DNA anti-recombination protein RmuC